MNVPDLTTIPVGSSAAVTVSADVAGTGMTGLAVRDPVTLAAVALAVPQVADIATALLAQTPDALPLVTERILPELREIAEDLHRSFDALRNPDMGIEGRLLVMDAAERTRDRLDAILHAEAVPA